MDLRYRTRLGDATIQVQCVISSQRSCAILCQVSLTPFLVAIFNPSLIVMLQFLYHSHHELASKAPIFLFLCAVHHKVYHLSNAAPFVD